MSKLAILTVLGATLLGACMPYAQPGYSYEYRHHHRHVVYVDGATYVDRDVVYGPAPAYTVIPANDPPVGTIFPPR